MPGAKTQRGGGIRRLCDYFVGLRFPAGAAAGRVCMAAAGGIHAGCGSWLGVAVPRVERGLMNFSRVLAAGVCAILLTACTGLAGYRIRTVQISRCTYLLGTDVAGYYGLRYSLSGERCVLRSAEHSLRFTADRREAVIDGTIVNLAVAPTLWRGALVFAEVDFRLLLDPILRPA